MPGFTINTNVPKSSIPAGFIIELSATVARILGKPETYVGIHINPDQMMTFAGTSDPAALCTLTCIGKLGLEENKSHTEELMELINKQLGIPKDRMYINFHDLARQDVGWNGKTFA